MTSSRILAAAALCAAFSLLAACEADDSLPTRPRTAIDNNFLAPSDKAKQNAEQRNLEKPARQLPINGTDLPGQSALDVTSSVVTLDSVPASGGSDSLISGFSGPSGLHAIGHTSGPTTAYNRDNYPSVIPHLPNPPGSVPATGSTPIPGGDWAVDHSWGQNLTLTNYPHRNWAPTTAVYQTATIAHNPTYYFNLQEHLPVKQNDGTLRGDLRSTSYEIPWFYLNTAALPILMVLEPPLAQRTTAVPERNPDFMGHLPEGPTVPSPIPGVLKWEYPFLNPDGTVERANSTPSSTNP
jgi:hypothetical protein